LLFVWLGVVVFFFLCVVWGGGGGGLFICVWEAV